MIPPRTLKQRYAEAAETGRPLLGGHRGNPAEFPENTMASFRSAIELGMDMIECDVHQSADGRLVVIHDHSVDRTTSGTGMVRDLRWEELRELDAGQGERLPLLEEVVDLACEAGVGVCIEIKQIPIPYPGIEQQVVDLLRERDMIEQAAVISFYHASCKLLKEIEPALQVGILEGARPIDPVRLLQEAGSDIYAPHYGAMDVELVQSIHATGGVVGVWTVDDAAGVLWCQYCKPDSVFTNRPREVGPLLRG